MPLFRPSLIGKLYRMTGMNAFGEATIAPAQSFAFSILEILILAKNTSVRKDVSASHGAAAEFVGTATLLVPPNSPPEPGDKIEAFGETLTVNNITAQYSLSGYLDHYQVLCNVWVKP